MFHFFVADDTCRWLYFIIFNWVLCRVFKILKVSCKMITFKIIEKSEAPPIIVKYKWENLFREALKLGKDHCLLIECTEKQERVSIVGGFRNQIRKGLFEGKGNMFIRTINAHQGNEYSEKRILYISFEKE